ncbi:MAG: hypothetical protein RLZZ142_257 [Verrucomicrobiota bacterium]
MAEVGEGEKAGSVSVRPLGLEGVAADGVEAAELEALGGEFALGAVDVSEHIGLALADGAGAGTAELFEADEGFGAVGPRDGEFLADLGDVGRGEARAHERTMGRKGSN